MSTQTGTGGELFIFLRNSTQGSQATAQENRLFAVLVCDTHSRVVAELSEAGTRSQDGKSLGCSLALAPGTYLLRFDGASAGVFEQSVVVSKGWQTQVFASSRLFGQSRHVLGPNLAEMAIFMRRQGLGFDPSEHETLVAEAARQALAEGLPVAPTERLRASVTEANAIRGGMPEEQVNDLLKLKFGNPMFGIYGAHLLLLSGEPDWVLLGEVVTNLKSLVGDHPDVLALTMHPKLRHLEQSATYEVPPMLRSSWRLVVAESVQRPDLVPLYSYSSAVANRTWGAGAWLVWRPPIEATAREEQRPAHTPSQPMNLNFSSALLVLQTYVEEHLNRQSIGQFVQETARNGNFSGTERTLLIYLAGMHYQGWSLANLIKSQSGLAERFFSSFREVMSELDQLLKRAMSTITAHEAAVTPAVTSVFNEDYLVKALGIPMASLHQAVVTLSRKLSRSAAKVITRSPEGR